MEDAWISVARTFPHPTPHARGGTCMSAHILVLNSLASSKAAPVDGEASGASASGRSRGSIQLSARRLASAMSPWVEAEEERSCCTTCDRRGRRRPDGDDTAEMSECTAASVRRCRVGALCTLGCCAASCAQEEHSMAMEEQSTSN